MERGYLRDIEVTEIFVTFANENETKGIASIEIKNWAVLRRLPWKIVGGKFVVRLPGIRDKKAGGYCHFISFGDKNIEKLIKKKVRKAVRERLLEPIC